VPVSSPAPPPSSGIDVGVDVETGMVVRVGVKVTMSETSADVPSA